MGREVHVQPGLGLCVLFQQLVHRHGLAILAAFAQVLDTLGVSHLAHFPLQAREICLGVGGLFVDGLGFFVDLGLGGSAAFGQRGDRVECPASDLGFRFAGVGQHQAPGLALLLDVEHRQLHLCPRLHVVVEHRLVAHGPGDRPAGLGHLGHGEGTAQDLLGGAGCQEVGAGAVLDPWHV